MIQNSKLAKAVRFALVCGLTASASNLAFAQETSASEEDKVEKISITGSRITAAQLASSSPITVIGEAAIEFLQEPEFERIMRLQPGIVPADGSNVNNGTAGAATISLRGLGAQRSLILLDGKRMTPFNVDGAVDTAGIPSALIKNIEIITGGASAVYGSDAIAGAVNVILKDDFEGVEIESNYQQTADSDGDRFNLALTMGSNLDNGKGNAVLSFSYFDRKAVRLDARSLGVFGIDSGSGAGYQEFLDGVAAILPPTDCQAEGAVDFVQGSGSTTSIPTRFEILGGGAGGSFQFRNDGSLGTQCSRFNFNPFNYYQTPSEKYAVTGKANYEINEHAEVFSSFNFTNTSVTQQIAPSGTFGASFDLPLYNPLIGASALNTILDAANTAVTNGILLDSNSGGRWIDTNANGVVDTEDTLGVRLRRRTTELGPRSTSISADLWQINLGVRGAITDNLDYELSYQYGESNRLNVDAGYTNLSNIQTALNTRDGINCVTGGSACVPINLFGGLGTITPEMAAYAGATGFQQDGYEQEIMTGFVSGSIEEFVLPTASNPFAFSAGFEKRKETAFINPDECLKLAPASCLGGAGGNTLPIVGGYSVDEFFMEGLLPLVEDADFADSLNLEFGYRTSDFSSFGTTDSWKLGLNWTPVNELLIRVMAQKANRAPNVGELSSPLVRGLGDATIDPCSVANPNITPEITALCISTGMTAGLVGTIPDIISGQINTFNGSDPSAPPNPEEADTITAGFVYSPTVDFAESLTISVDYYDIEITDVIGSFSPQEVLDGCYLQGDVNACSKIRRQSGDLTGDLAGVETFFTNLDYLQAEGLEIGYNAVFSLGENGNLSVSGSINKYLTQESQSSATTPVLDCKGNYGTSCDPISDLRWNQRVTWDYQDLSLSLFWRHIGAVDLLESEQPSVFEAFRSIDAYNYIDIFASYAVTDYMTVSAGIDNLTDEAPPVVGGEVGDTSSNGGNTFPSNYDVLGTMYKVGVKFRF